MRIKIVFGIKSTRSNWGKIGCSHGAVWGWYDNYCWGLKYVGALWYYRGGGEYSEPHKYWPGDYRY